MENYIIIAIVLCIIGGIIFYLYRAKKRGQACIGCPYSKECSGKCNSACNGGCDNTKTENRE